MKDELLPRRSVIAPEPHRRQLGGRQRYGTEGRLNPFNNNRPAGFPQKEKARAWLQQDTGKDLFDAQL